MKLFNPYCWLYAKLYVLARSTSTENTHFSVICLIAMLISFNLIVIICLLDLFFNISIPQRLVALPEKDFFIGYLCWIAINFLYFCYGKRYEKILLEFNVASKLKEPYSYLPGFFYIVLTISGIFLLAFLR